MSFTKYVRGASEIQGIHNVDKVGQVGTKIINYFLK